MSPVRKRWLYRGLIVFAILALLNPGYSYVSVEGPNGPIRLHKFRFGPGNLVTYTRVVADESGVEIEQN